MSDAKSTFKEIIFNAVKEFYNQKGIEADADLQNKIVVQSAPNPEMGDLGAPMFVFAKALRMAPPQIAAEVAKIAQAAGTSLGQVMAVGPYVNIKLDKAGAAFPILDAAEGYLRFAESAGQKASGRPPCNDRIFFSKYKQASSFGPCS